MIKYILVLSILLFAGCKSSQKSNTAQSGNNYYLYIGTYTDAGSEGIYRAQFSSDSGKISNPVLVARVNNPSYQCITPDKTQLWSVNESGGGKGAVIGFQINASDGSLKEINEFSSQGSGPCFVSYHEASQTVMAANYNSGNVIRIHTGEKNTGEAYTQQHEGTGPLTSRQASPHAHCIKVGPNGQYAYSCDLGADKIYVYRLDETGLKVHTIIHTTAGAGPRHIAFHPGHKAMSVICELNATVETYLPDEDGCFNRFSSEISTLPEDFTASNKCADIHYSPDGNFLYASNRGHNSIVTFQIDQETLQPTLIGWMQDEIDWPRNFTITPDGDYLLVANKDSNTITVYRVNHTTGQLTFTGNKISVSKPVCLNLFPKTANND